MISIDGVLLGLSVIAILTAFPLGTAIVGLCIWVSQMPRRGRRAA